VVRDGGREQSQRPGALHDHALVRLDAPHAVEGVDDGAQRAAGRGSHAVRHGVGDAHAAGGREHVAVLREAADQVREALAVGPHVLLLAAAERRRVLHAALLTLPAVDVGPQQAVADRERLADGVLARPRAERDHRAHHLVAQHDRQLRGRQRLRHPVPLMHVRAADRCDVDAHEEGAGLELVLAGHRQLADLDRLAVLGDDGRARGLGQAHGDPPEWELRAGVYRCSRSGTRFGTMAA
jgi:hypothetical protein